MNNQDTIRAITPIVNSFFRDGLKAETALDIIGSILKENAEANPKPGGLNMQVYPTEGLTPESVAAAHAHHKRWAKP